MLEVSLKNVKKKFKEFQVPIIKLDGPWKANIPLDIKQKYLVWPKEKEDLNILGQGVCAFVLRMNLEIMRNRRIIGNECVAVKFPKIENHDNRYETTFTDSVMRELEILCKLDSKFIVKLLGVVPQAPGVPEYLKKIPIPCLVMECASHGNLSELLELKTLSLDWNEKKRSILLDIFNGLEYLHNKSIAHKDLKTSNILIFEGLKAKISDFGISIFSNNSDGVRYRGDFEWLAPEMLQKNNLIKDNIAELYYPCDIWAFGLIIGSLLKNEEPFKYIKNEKKQLFSPEWLCKFYEETIARNMLTFYGKDIKAGISPNKEEGKIVNKVLLGCLNKERDKRATVQDLNKLFVELGFLSNVIEKVTYTSLDDIDDIDDICGIKYKQLPPLLFKHGHYFEIEEFEIEEEITIQMHYKCTIT